MSPTQLAGAIYRRFNLQKYPQIAGFLRRLNRWYLSRGTRVRIRGTGNSVTRNGAVLKKVTINIAGSNNTVRIAPSAYVSGVNILMTGSNHSLTIGENCRLNNGGVFWFQDENCRVEMGANSTMESFTICLIEPDMSVTIGRDCMFSDGVDLRTADSHSIVDLSTGKRTNWAAPIVVQDHVWIAMHARVTKGVTIGSGSVISAASLVTKDIPSNALAGGVPARVLRENFTWERERLGPDDVIQSFKPQLPTRPVAPVTGSG